MLINNDDDSSAKLIDFGMSTTADLVKDNPTEYCGTYTTMAPEMLMKEEYGTQVDVWSVGIIFFELIANRLPFESKRRNVY